MDATNRPSAPLDIFAEASGKAIKYHWIPPSDSNKTIIRKFHNIKQWSQAKMECRFVISTPKLVYNDVFIGIWMYECSLIISGFCIKWNLY